MAVRWNEELCARLKSLWPDHSAAAISAIFRSEGFDFSRNAVIGIAHRLELTSKLQVRLSRPPTVKKGVFQHVVRKANRVRLRVVNSGGNQSALTFKTIDARLPALRCVEIALRNIPLVDLEPNDCRFIAGDDYLYCGHPQKAGSSYCPAHDSLVWIPANPRRAAA